LGEADHVREIVSPASLGVSNALNSAGGMRKAGDCATSVEVIKKGIKKIPVIKNVFFDKFMF